MDNRSISKKNILSSSNVPQSSNTFEFETESLPLKSNADYHALVRHLNILTAMRTQSLEDINKVLDVQDAALSDPLAFITKLKRGEDTGIPNRMVIPDMPEIIWSKYNTTIDALRSTRPKTKETKLDVFAKATNGDTVRGRVKDESKPQTFNQLWTSDEQLQLEQLLVKYPPERNEARRFAKIAEELGNRTPAQVTSRCQKYFKKLAAMGLPVPGRVPRLRRDNMKGYKSSRGGMSSTFFPYSVAINDFDDLPGTMTVQLCTVKEEPDISDESCDRPDSESRRQQLLRRVRSDLMRSTNTNAPHHGYTCNICKEDPVRGTRWHCAQCADVDFCSRCLVEQLEAKGSTPHPLDHAIVSCRPVVLTNGDKDYNDPSQLRYLDTNFRPD